MATTRGLDARIFWASSRVAIGKNAFYKQIDMPQHQAYDFTKEVMSLNARSPDAHEGITAFLEKRKPKWTNSQGTK